MQKTKQLSFRIPVHLHKRLKVYASRHGKTIRQVILESLPFTRQERIR